MKDKIQKYKNFGYAIAFFFYFDLSVAVFAYVGKDFIENYQIKTDVENILNTPDLTSGLEVLEQAVEMDLADLEKTLNQNI